MYDAIIIVIILLQKAADYLFCLFLSSDVEFVLFVFLFFTQLLRETHMFFLLPGKVKGVYNYVLSINKNFIFIMQI